MILICKFLFGREHNNCHWRQFDTGFIYPNRVSVSERMHCCCLLALWNHAILSRPQYFSRYTSMCTKMGQFRSCCSQYKPFCHTSSSHAQNTPSLLRILGPFHLSLFTVVPYLLPEQSWLSHYRCTAGTVAHTFNNVWRLLQGDLVSHEFWLPSEFEAYLGPNGVMSQQKNKTKQNTPQYLNQSTNQSTYQ